MNWKSLPLAFALFFSPGLHAQTAPTAQAEAPVALSAVPDHAPAVARPALWVVKDKDTTIYLFGTIHLLKPALSWFDGPLRAAFDKSQEVVLEVVERDNPTSQDAILQRALQLDGLPLSNKLDEKARDAYFAVLQQHGVSTLLFDRVKPWFAAFTLTVLPLQSLGYDPESGADRAIERAAIAAGKKLTGLETAEEQLGFFEAMPEGLQLSLLNETINQLPDLQKNIEEMIAAWGAGQPDELARLMNESMDDTPEIGRILLTDRNARWADWIKARLARPGTVFIAVGAGHLAGAGSVQEMLAERGVTTQLVEQAD